MRCGSGKAGCGAWRLLTALLAFCGFCCCDAKPTGPDGTKAPPRQVRQFLGEQVVETLSAPTKVQTFRLASRSEGPASPATGPTESLHGYRVAAAGPELDAAFGSRVATALFDPGSYQFDSAKACEFDPGVAFRVWKGREHLDVLLCFSCSEFRVYHPQPGGQVRRVGEDFDDNRRAFVRLAKEAFPADPAINRL